MIKSKNGEVNFNKDEHPREGINLEALERLKPVFSKTAHHSYGNASGINDGAAAVTLMTNKEAEKRGLQKLVTIKSLELAVGLIHGYNEYKAQYLLQKGLGDSRLVYKRR